MLVRTKNSEFYSKSSPEIIMDMKNNLLRNKIKYREVVTREIWPPDLRKYSFLWSVVKFVRLVFLSEILKNKLMSVQ